MLAVGRAYQPVTQVSFSLLLAGLLLITPPVPVTNLGVLAQGTTGPEARIRKTVRAYFRQVGGRHRYHYRRVRIIRGIVANGVGLYYAIVPSKKLDELYIPVVLCEKELLLNTLRQNDSARVKKLDSELNTLLRCVSNVLPDSVSRIKAKFWAGEFRRLKPGVYVHYR